MMVCYVNVFVANVSKVVIYCICASLQSSNIAEKNQVDARKKLACNQRTQLSDLYYGRNRPPTSCSCLYLVSVDFVNDWKSFIRYVPCDM